MSGNTYEPHSPFVEYVEQGWALTSIEAGTKGPRVKGWNERKNAITDPAQAGRLAGAGLLHAYSGTCALDVDDFTEATAWLAARGIDLEELLLADDAVQIRSGVGNRAKLLYALAEPLRSVQVKGADGAVLFELRCGANGGLSVQDVLPPSLHPSGSHYAWAGSGSWDALPPLPEPLRAIWHGLLQPTAEGAAGTAKPASPPVTVRLTKEQLQALREAVFFLEAESYEDWTNVGLALAELGDQGRGLWLSWSATSDKFDPTAATKKWATFGGAHSHWRAVLKMAADRGWVNAGAGAARGETPAGGEAGGGEEEPDEHTGTGGGEEEPPELMIPAAMAVPEIPTSILPGVLGAMAEAVSAYTQTPPAAAVLEVLGVLAACCHGRYEVEPYPGYKEPLALWTLGALDPGSRKTAVQNELIGPLVGWERLQRERLDAGVASVAAQRAVAEKVITRLENQASKADRDERKRLETEIERERQDMPAELKPPHVFTSDSTAEQVQQLLVDHGGRIAVIADEGGIFQIMAGAYSGGIASIDVYLQGHSGSPLRVDRGSRSAYVNRPAVSFALLIQPGIMRDAGRNKRFKDSGLLARFLYAVPASNVGQRDIRATVPIPGEVMREYHATLMALLDNRKPELQEPDILRLRPDAYERLMCFAESVERRHGPGRELESITDWTAKLPGAVARIGALLHLAAGPNDLEVRDDSMRRAVELGERLIPHTLAAYELMGMSGAEEDAHALLRWVKTQRKDSFFLRDAYKALRRRFPKVDRLNEAAKQLEDWHVITRRREVKSSPRGGRPTELLQVNPRLFRS